ncbi:MAG: alanyl-tRNA editing protein [Candidatus Bathyarchaeota archaeon]|nr:alanyl-tRNA editing protein [Candidatus Bathyarchaeota archaeon]
MVRHKLYNEDHYLKEFTGIVLSIEDNLVELDQTAFYAESGGQKGDKGTLNGEQVTDTIFVEDRIMHVMEASPSFKVGDTLNGVIDWERRYRIMKLHTASHIMEYFLWKNFGYMKRTGSTVDDKKDRADYEHDKRLDPEKLKQTETDTNSYLAEGHEVVIEVDENGIRNWRCGPVEMHCAGTHVQNTNEIGAIKLKRKNPGRGEERVETSLAE